MTVRSGDFARAVEHARREVLYYERQIQRLPKYASQLTSAQIALEALLLIGEYDCQEMIRDRVNGKISDPKMQEVAY